MEYKQFLKIKSVLTLIVLALAIELAIFAYDNSEPETIEEKKHIYYQSSDFSKLKDWHEQNFVQLKYSFMNNCDQLERYYRTKDFDDKFGTLEQWGIFCQGLDALSNNEKEIRNYFENLELLQVVQEEGKRSLFTGYYSPLLKGNVYKTERYNYPLYKRPPDLVEVHLKDFFSDTKYKFRKIYARLSNNRLIPYYTREQIDRDNVVTEDNVLLWVESKIDAFFLHIQGSGQVLLPDNTIINVGYAAQNGQAYYAIGRYMVKHGMLKKEEVSLQSIREYLENNPDRVDEVLNTNPSYIFFTERSDGPYGAFGNVLTPDHSVAIDRHFVPLGTPMFVSTKVTATGQDFNNMVFAQDIGGAIKGAVRADIYFGSDLEAEEYSGKQNQEGEMYVFSAKNL